MWNKVRLCLVLFVAILSTDTSGYRLRKPLSREQIYMDVLKNISQTHQTLNQLLGHYRNLKAMYDVHAKPYNELSVEVQSRDKDKLKKNEAEFDKDVEFHPVTQMILFDEVIPEENSDESNENVDDNENLQPQIPETESDSNTYKESIAIAVQPNKSIDLTKTHLLLHNTKINTYDSTSNQLNKPELIILGTALKHAKESPNKRRNKIKTLESGLNFSRPKYLNAKKPSLRVGSYNGYNYKNFNQPRKWRSSFEQLHKGKGDIEKNYRNKSILVMVLEGDQKDLLLKSKKYDSDSKKREEEMLRREQTERKILRDAYGNACLKVAVRKCYKTLIQVKKIVCMSQMKCKHSFKQKFKSKSKIGCMSEFNYKKEDTGSKKKPTTYYDRKRTENNDNIQELDDPMRAGSTINYYQLCLPIEMTEETNTKKVTKKKPRDSDRLQPINVLRDRFEKECKRLSTERCERACLFAVTESCEKCSRKNKKSLTRTCKQECRESFGGRSNSDSDSDTDTDSDDDSDSDDSEGSGDIITIE